MAAHSAQRPGSSALSGSRGPPGWCTPDPRTTTPHGDGNLGNSCKRQKHFQHLERPRERLEQASRPKFEEVRLPSGNSSDPTNIPDNSNKPAAACTRRDRSACDRRQFPYCPPACCCTAPPLVLPRRLQPVECGERQVWLVSDPRFNRDWFRFPFPVALQPSSSPE
jgi:hypothetical protein